MIRTIDSARNPEIEAIHFSFTRAILNYCTRSLVLQLCGVRLRYRYVRIARENWALFPSPRGRK